MIYVPKKPFSIRAFTLIELMVSVSIMTIVLGITLMQRPEATIKLSLADVISSAELMVREAQLQGSAVNSLNDTYGGAGFFLNLASSSQALRFRDRVDESIPSTLGIGNGLYESTPLNEQSEILEFMRGNKVKKLCVSTGTSTFFCNEENDPQIRTLTVSFNRPSPNANIYINSSKDVNYVSACAQFETLKAPNQGHVRSLFIYRSGVVTKTLTPCN